MQQKSVDLISQTCCLANRAFTLGRQEIQDCRFVFER